MFSSFTTLYDAQDTENGSAGAVAAARSRPDLSTRRKAGSCWWPCSVVLRRWCAVASDAANRLNNAVGCCCQLFLVKSKKKCFTAKFLIRTRVCVSRLVKRPPSTQVRGCGRESGRVTKPCGRTGVAAESHHDRGPRNGEQWRRRGASAVLSVHARVAHPVGGADRGRRGQEEWAEEEEGGRRGTSSFSCTIDCSDRPAPISFIGCKLIRPITGSSLSVNVVVVVNT